MVWESFRCLVANTKWAVMCLSLRSGEEWLPSGHSTIKVECCGGGCSSRSLSHIHRGTLELCQSDHLILGHLPDQGSSPPIAQFGRPASSRKSLGGSKRLPFKNDGGHCVFGDLQCRPSPDLCLATILSWGTTNNSFDLVAWFLLWHAQSTVGPYIDRCGTFQIMSNQLNLPQVDSNQVVETSQIRSMETRCTWAQFRVS